MPGGGLAVADELEARPGLVGAAGARLAVAGLERLGPAGAAAAGAEPLPPGGASTAAALAAALAAPRACAAAWTASTSTGVTNVGGAAAREKDIACARWAGAGRSTCPVPSIVVTAMPSSAHTGRRHELMDRCS